MLKIGWKLTRYGRRRADKFSHILRDGIERLLADMSEDVRWAAVRAINLGKRHRVTSRGEPQDDPGHPHLRNILKGHEHIQRMGLIGTGPVLYGIGKVSVLDEHVGVWRSGPSRTRHEGTVPIWRVLEFGSKGHTISPRYGPQTLAFPDDAPGDLVAKHFPYEVKRYPWFFTVPTPPLGMGRNLAGVQGGQAPFRSAFFQHTPIINKKLRKLMRDVARL